MQVLHWLKRLWLLAWLAMPVLCAAQAPAAREGPQGSQLEADAVLEVYVRDGCPHCAAAKAFLPQFLQRRPWLQVVYRPVDQDEAARADLIRISRDSGLWPPGVPTFAYQGQVLVGFADAELSGPELDRLVSQGRKPPPAAGSLQAGFWGTLRLDSLGLPLFTLAVGLVDGFNPCAMWVLLFLLSLLVHLRDRRRMALIAGTFVLVSGLVYYAFMAAWLNLFLAVGLSAAVRTGLALLALAIAGFNLKDFAFGLQGPTLSIPGSAKPGLYARMREVMRTRSLPLTLLGAASLAVAVNFIELLCTAGLPAMYTAILTQQDLGPAGHYGYLGLYILGYIADDSLMVGTAVLALSQRRLDEQAGRWLKLVSGLVMLALGLVMLLRPDWLL